jgi:hypothetical protein
MRRMSGHGGGLRRLLGALVVAATLTVVVVPGAGAAGGSSGCEGRGTLRAPDGTRVRAVRGTQVVINHEEQYGIVDCGEDDAVAVTVARRVRDRGDALLVGPVHVPAGARLQLTVGTDVAPLFMDDIGALHTVDGRELSAGRIAVPASRLHLELYDATGSSVHEVVLDVDPGVVTSFMGFEESVDYVVGVVWDAAAGTATAITSIRDTLPLRVPDGDGGWVEVEARRVEASWQTAGAPLSDANWVVTTMLADALESLGELVLPHGFMTYDESVDYFGAFMGFGDSVDV